MDTSAFDIISVTVKNVANKVDGLEQVVLKQLVVK